MACAAHHLGQSGASLSGKRQARVPQIVKVQFLDADLLARRLPGVMHVVGSKLAAVRAREDPRGRERRASLQQVFAQGIDCRFRQMHETTAADLWLGDHRTDVVDLDDLALDADRSGSEVDIPALQSEQFTEARVRPERDDHEAPEMCRHRIDELGDSLEVGQRSLRAVRLPGAADATRVAEDQVVGDSRVQDRPQ
ncbi:MAG TPA: hypothetical protein VHD58_00930 [Mycobacteriales bacterium]|nr:hypothetical protein [Mycobacteriales bacterium]